MDMRETVRFNILTTSEVAELLQVSKQRVSTLVKEGKLVPIKKDSQGMIFLRSDVFDYKNSNWKRDSGKIFAEFTRATDMSIDFYRECIDKVSDIQSIHVYGDSFDATVNNFYIESDFFVTQNLRAVDSPSMIIRDTLGYEIWLSGCNCGYVGTGPSGTIKVLKDLESRGRLRLDIPYPELENLIMKNEVINIYSNNNDDAASIIATKTAINNCEHLNTWSEGGDIYLHNGHPVLLQSSEAIKEGAERFFNRFRAFVPHPAEILIYTDMGAAEEAGYLVSNKKILCRDCTYQMIIKDRSGRELWLQVKLNKWAAPESRPDIKGILASCGFEVEAESPKLLGWLGKGMSLITGKAEQPLRFVNID